MKSRRIWTVALAPLVFAGSAVGEYDFFAGARYPGPVKNPGVDVYRVKQAGDPNARSCKRKSRQRRLHFARHTQKH